MIDEISSDRRGWARFSDDRAFRYRLARSLTDAELVIDGDRVTGEKRVVFLMLNPSDADAFKPDPTISKCMEFSRRWGGDVVEAVNLFSLVSSLPAELYKRAHGMRGDDEVSMAAISAACAGAFRVVAAWGTRGNDPKLGWRANAVTAKLVDVGIELWCLDRTSGGAPKHPHARGKHRIPFDREPTRWA